MLSTPFPREQNADCFTTVDDLARQWRKILPSVWGSDAMRSYEEDFLVRMAYNSNAIEGSTLTLAETEIIYEGEFVPGRPGREQIAARGIFEGWDYLSDRLANGAALNKALILDTHERCALDLQPRARGVFRNAPAIIRASRTTPTAPLKIREEIDDLLFHYERLHGTAHPLTAIAWFHAAFEAIHPFADGNGRTGRLLLNAQLKQYGYAPASIKASHSLEYKQALEAWQVDGNDRPFMELLLFCEIEELEKRLAFAAQIPQTNSLTTSDQLIALVCENPSITTAHMADQLGLSSRQVQRILRALQDEGRLRRIGSRKAGAWKVTE